MPDRPAAWRVLASRYLLRRPWMNVREDHVRLPHGAEIDAFHVLEYPDWASVIPLTDDGRLVLVEQYRHGRRRVALELPAGVVDAGETPAAAARRELLEETGYAADDWTPLPPLAPEPARHSNRAHGFLARGVRRVAAPAPEASEHLRVQLVPLGAVEAMVRNGEIEHAVHLAQLLWARAAGWLDG